jgi:ABC-type branched-subunit amino acid transport system ATPase component
MAILLDIKHLNAGYGPLQVLWDVSLAVPEGGFVALVGPNGAGKSTLLKVVAGLIHPHSSDITFRGASIAGLPAHQINQFGVSLIPEELNLFTGMTVVENLQLGSFARKDDKAAIQKSLDFILDLFPVLAKRSHQLAGTLSGGERKMLAIGRGLMTGPKILLVDEPSLGLSPILSMAVFEALQELNQRGIAILLVEQNVDVTLSISSYTYVLEQGSVALQGPSTDLANDKHVKDTYLGIV